MDYEKLARLISYDESGAMTVRREDGAPALDLFDTEDRSGPLTRLHRAYRTLRGRL